MNTTRRTTVVALGVAGLLAAGLATASAQNPQDAARTSALASATVGDRALASTLTFNREEERMARDLYAAIADLYDGARPFSMITTSEQQHFEAVGRLLATYGIVDPAAGRAAGSYADPALQALYDGWLTKAKASLSAAYQAGVELEQRDIADLTKAMAASPQDDVDAVLGNLLKASGNHLNAFQNAASGATRTMGNAQGRGFGMGNGHPGNAPGQSDKRGQGQGRHAGMGATGRPGPATGGCPNTTS